MDALVSRALMIRLSLQPSPASETSAFNKIRAFSSRCAGLFPFRISASSRSRSSPLSRTTYFFTEISFAAMIASITRVATTANHEILSNWLKRATRLCGQEEAHEARRVSSGDGGGGAVVSAGSSDRAALSEGGSSRGPSSISDRRDVAHLLPAAMVQSV